MERYMFSAKKWSIVSLADGRYSIFLTPAICAFERNKVVKG
jgi:hypothetical protein